MPTIPRKLHQIRHVAESFGVDAQRYDQARPRYPDALVERILAASPGTDVLDVGCGTGIAARQFQATGATVLGVEPDERMAEFARHGGLDVEVATFETWEPAGRMFDIVTAGQSWHWVDPAAGTAKAAQVLRPGGRLAIFAHVFEPPPAVATAGATALRRVVPDSPFAQDRPAVSALELYQTGFTRLANGIGETNEFDEPEQWRFDWTRDYTRDEWLELLPTTGGLTSLPPDKLAEVLTDVGAAIDTMGGGFTMSYVTLAIVAARTGAA
jgi:SAM-dependent methyltransferase